jgi:nitric oxide reductase subunit C
MVTGLGATGGNAASPAAAAGSAAAATVSDKDPVALGERVFRSAAPACTASHSLTPGADMAGPSLAGIATRTQETLASPDYKGSATDLATYIRESITHPSAHLAEGAMYSADGVSFMPNTYAKDLTSEQVAHLAAYLATFK